MKLNRHKTKTVKIANLAIGGDNPILIQSMAKTKTADIEKTLKQIKDLEAAGCEIVRLAVKDEHDASALKEIKKNTTLPIVADIHFSWRLALGAIDNGADKIRLNPGNIYKNGEIREITRAAKLNRIPIRVGVNSGSLKGHQDTRTPGHRSQADMMVESALDYIKILERFKFYDIVVSLKASGVQETVEAYRKISRLCDYPLHLGVTATGSPYKGAIKSAIALGLLLSEGIGDTIRVSLTDEPVEEVKAAKIILETLNLRRYCPEIISCPTCGRCEVDLIKIVKELENALSRYPESPLFCSTGKPGTCLPAGRNRQTGKHLKVAVMGCVVNGPGEAREADIGIAFGRKVGLLFKEGRPVRKVSPEECVEVLLKEITKH